MIWNNFFDNVNNQYEVEKVIIFILKKWINKKIEVPYITFKFCVIN